MTGDPFLSVLLSVLASGHRGAWTQDVSPGRPFGPATAAAAAPRPADGAGSLVHAGYAVFRASSPPNFPSELAKPLARDGRFEPGYFLVHFRSAVSAADRTWLDRLTGPILRQDGSELARWYLPDDTLAAWVADPATWLALERSERTDGIGRYEPAYKLDPALLDAPADLPLRLNVDLIPGHPLESVSAGLEVLGARVLGAVEHRGRGAFDLCFLVVEAEPRLLTRLARVEGIRLVQERGEVDPVADEGLPRELDARWVAALAQRARAGLALSGELPGLDEVAVYDEVTALLDLLAFDHPELCVAVRSTDPFARAEWPPKNALGIDAREAAGDALARLADTVRARVQGAGPSAALRKALWIDAADATAANGRSWIVHDVARAEGFRGTRDAPAVHAFRCAGTLEPLRVTLAWTDEPGSVGPGKKLINDLDLVVTAPDGTVYRGNRFGGSEGNSVPGGRSDSRLQAENVQLTTPRAGVWTATVRPARGNFAAAQGYALVVSGPVRESTVASEPLRVPTTVVLEVSAGQHSANGALVPAALERLRASDDLRYSVRDLEDLTLTFEPALPAESVVSAVRVFIEHHEQPRIASGDVLWLLGQGPSVLASTGPPVRYGSEQEALDVWIPSSLPADPDGFAVVIQNASPYNATVLDRVFVELDYVSSDAPSDPGPHITSAPNPTATVGQAYAYDADEHAEASGPGPILWSVVGGPAGFQIHSTSGLVSWTPDASGSIPITIQASSPSGGALQTFVVEVSDGAPLPATVLPSNASPIPYVPPERLAFGAAKSQQRLNVFLPRGVAPPSGWPVVVNNRAGGGIAAAPLPSIDDSGGTAPLHAFLESGIAVVDFGITAIGNGKGLFYPPGHPSGRYESFRPADDTPEKEAEWAVQWIKTQASFPLDEHSLCLRGASQGAILSIWAAMGPERARASGSSQVRVSTRAKAVLALQPPTSIWAMDQTPAINSRMVGHFEQAAFPGVAATAFGQVAPQLQKDGSVMGFAFRTAAARAHNEEQPICLLFAEPVKTVAGGVADMTLGADGYPRLHDTIGQPFIHDGWSGYVFYQRLIGLSARSERFHADHSVFAMRDTTALPPPLDVHTQTFSGDVFGTQATALAHAWVLRTLRADAPTIGSVLHGAGH